MSIRSREVVTHLAIYHACHFYPICHLTYWTNYRTVNLIVHIPYLILAEHSNSFPCAPNLTCVAVAILSLPLRTQPNLQCSTKPKPTSPDLISPFSSSPAIPYIYLAVLNPPRRSLTHRTCITLPQQSKPLRCYPIRCLPRQTIPYLRFHTPAYLSSALHCYSRPTTPNLPVLTRPLLITSDPTKSRLTCISVPLDTDPVHCKPLLTTTQLFTPYLPYHASRRPSAPKPSSA